MKQLLSERIPEDVHHQLVLHDSSFRSGIWSYVPENRYRQSEGAQIARSGATLLIRQGQRTPPASR
jgi:hypothetical protein